MDTSIGGSASPLKSMTEFKLDNTTAPTERKVFALFRNDGKTAVVTGAAGGIGLEAADALAESGANVAIWYNTNTKAIERAEAIAKEYGVKCKAYQVNVSDASAVQDAVDTVVKEFNGRLDIFVANAAAAWSDGSILDAPVESYHKLMRTNLDGVYYCARAAGKHWRRQKFEGTDVEGKKLENFRGGSFIATSSIGSSRVNMQNLQAPYHASKAGVDHMCRALAVEFVPFARVNIVSPGYIRTGMMGFIPDEVKEVFAKSIAMGRIGSPQEMKGAYVYLASNASSYVTGTSIEVDGGSLLT